MTAQISASAAQLRRRLADELEADGDLRSAVWRRAVETVPREVFLGERVYQRRDTPTGTLWEPTTRGDVGDEAWLELAYTDTTWVTQLDGHDSDASGPVQGAPTSSSTLPSLVVGMLEDLDIADGHRVLEIGTGTGYSGGLLCQRLGDACVTSIEVDPQVASRAASSLAAAGYSPTLITGDGLAGHPEGAPYDRIIATCSARTVPAAWLAQTRPAGRILVTLSGWLYGSGLVALEVTGDGQAHGRFLEGTVSFMVARPHAAPPLTVFPDREGQERPARYGPQILTDWTGRFLAQLTVPAAQHVQLTDPGGGPPTDLVIDQASGSYAWLSTTSDQDWTVVQGGPARLWDQIEDTYATWKHVGEPAQHEFTFTITPDGQRIELDTHDGPRTWTLPAGRASRPETNSVTI